LSIFASSVLIFGADFWSVFHQLKVMGSTPGQFWLSAYYLTQVVHLPTPVYFATKQYNLVPVTGQYGGNHRSGIALAMHQT